MPSSKINIVESCGTIKSMASNVFPPEICLVTSTSMLNFVDETCISRKFNVKVKSFPEAKINDMYYYIIPLLEKNPCLYDPA